MIYFTVEKEFVRGKMFRHEVESDGSQASDSYGVDDEDANDVFEMTIGFTVNTYDEQGVHIDTVFTRWKPTRRHSKITLTRY